MEPPKCPKCGEPLETIYVVKSGELLDWNDEKGKYESDEAQLSVTYCCQSCGYAIGGWKANGDSWGFIPEVE